MVAHTASVGPSLSQALREHRDEVVAIVRDAGMHNARVFGSVARGEDAPGSDLDLVVTVDGPIGLFGLLEAQGRMSRLLGVEVDLVIDRDLRPGIEAEVRSTVVAL